MFNKIQHYLLLRHPLLWNIKVVPMLAITIAINAFFFLIGFAKGSLNFSARHRSYDYNDTTPTILFFSVLLSIIVLILWLVYYFRNNAFKSFYPKNNLSLYKEWLLILLISFLNCTYTAAFLTGEEIRKTSYVSEEELQHRLDIISMASLFTDDSFTYTPVQAQADTVYTPVKDTAARQKNSPVSLLDKNINGFGSYSHWRHSHKGLQRDSVNNERIKSWLAKNRRDSVLWLFNEFNKIADIHGIKGNITAEQWVNLVYKAPYFTDFEVIATNDGLEDDYGQSDTVIPKYYVPYDALRYNYEKIYTAQYRPFIDPDSILAYLITAFSMSLFIFSFRVTSGRSWLIALVSVGIMAMLVGLFAVIFRSGTAYPVMWLITIGALVVYYFSTVEQKRGKGISDIALNALIWLLATVLPISMSVVIINHQTNYENYVNQVEDKSLGKWLEDHFVEIMYVNLLIIVVYMFFISVSVKKWKGISES
jgi:hypothetical protein